MGRKIFTGCVIIGMMLSSSFTAQSEEMPKADAEAVWNYITKLSPYKDWSFWPEHQGLRDSTAPHSPKHKIYVNKPALESTAPPLQEGSLVIKENLSPAGELKAVTIMYKVKDYNPDAGDWFWVKYSTSGEALKKGKVKACIDCHAKKTDNDYILVHEFK